MRQKVVILGAGESGTGAALLAKSKGHEVFVSDSGTIASNYKKELIAKGIPFEEEGHSSGLFDEETLVIKSPGISFSAQVVDEAFTAGANLIDEIEFAFTYTSKPIIAVTGTNGKTTTTLLIHHLLSKAGVQASLAGNVGYSFARQVIADTADVYVVEVSSFQLDCIEEFRPKIAIILNVTPDHLDRYANDFEEYRWAKVNIARKMDGDDLLLYLGDDADLAAKTNDLEHEPQLVSITLKEEKSSKGNVGVNGLQLEFQGSINEVPVKYWPLQGNHNALNMLFAIYAVLQYGVPFETILKHLPAFKNAPNRMERVAFINDIEFVNDTKATNVEAVYYALGSYSKNIVWIAGGQDKGNNYSQIKDLVQEKVKAMVCLGADNTKLTEFFKPLVPAISETTDVNEAVSMAYNYANDKDVVLLSPACASFDLFDNYAQRGELFKEAVLKFKHIING